ncbi:hypothetical protein [uncultured Fusobacterium sp.]|jgi:hypothetical protein|uniref:hypothetical protein n=1 Tax=uncultured Fusobacterium sp. TaxID=159267 RepID=UPI0025D877E5|nr:hypothetical protein [uncultured Fusobacterium sp.]MCF2638517.1 hypothetical protein [Fusobacterium varium]
MQELKDKNFEYKIIEVDGIKVFIPEYLKGIKEIRISSLFSVFSKLMILNVEIDSL